MSEVDLVKLSERLARVEAKQDIMIESQRDMLAHMQCQSHSNEISFIKKVSWFNLTTLVGLIISLIITILPKK